MKRRKWGRLDLIIAPQGKTLLSGRYESSYRKQVTIQDRIRNGEMVNMPAADLYIMTVSISRAFVLATLLGAA